VEKKEKRRGIILAVTSETPKNLKTKLIKKTKPGGF
jgi:hypothetical protein